MRNVKSTADLQDAIRKLEAFSRKAAERSQSSSLSKSISMVRAFWRKAQSLQNDEEQNELLQAVETVNRERLKIQKMQQGSPAEQKLADALTSAIESYNQHAMPDKGLAQFFSEKLVTAPELPKIHLPQQLTVTYNYPQNAAYSGATQCAMNAIKPMVQALSKQAAELFQMKVLALLERYGIASNPEARSIVKSSPIHTTMEADENATCTLTQTLTLFPGQTIVVKGQSVLDPKTKTISRLFPDTFFISLKSTQTAFPHASQRGGWALVNQLLPECPQRMDLLDGLAELFLRKKRAMQDLLPHGPLIGKAKQLLKVKKKVFAAHQTELLNMHHQHSLVLAPHAGDVVDEFFGGLHRHPHAFDCLVETNQAICEYFISNPHQQLFEAILNGKHTDLGSPHAELRYRGAKAILEQTLNGVEPQNDYIRSMGHILGKASHHIILQYVSEDLVFEPPVLTPFERQMQAAAYRQVHDFLNELDSPLGDEQAVYELMKAQIIADLEGDLGYTDALAAYFQQRFASLRGL